MKIKITFIKAILISVAAIIFWALLPIIILHNSAAEDTTWYKIGGVFLMLVPVLIVLYHVKDEMRTAFNIFGALKGKGATIKNGRRAEAEILAINENSGGGVLTINDQPVANLKLRVHDGGKSPYVVSIDAVIPRLAVLRLMPGARVPVLIDPKDDNKIMVDFDKF